MTRQAILVKRGLEGVVMGQTRLSRVDGEAGRLTLAGFAVEDLAPRVRFEQVAFLLWHDHLPDASELAGFERTLREARTLPERVLDVLRDAAARPAAGEPSSVPPIDALRLAVAALALEAPSQERLVATLPTMVAAFVRLRGGHEPCAPDPSLDHAANFLFMLRGTRAREAEARALHTYLNTVVDHGMNASTFAARVIASTGSDLAASVEGALAALKGPLHGGAPGPALEALLRLRAASASNGPTLDERTRSWVRERVEAGQRVMGFGHRVYRVRDPRADVLAGAAAHLLGETSLYVDAVAHERAVVETLRALKPGRRLDTNVEFYTALLLHGLGLTPELFTPTFAISRAAGWAAHFTEQRTEGRLLRPRVAYVGAEGRVAG